MSSARLRRLLGAAGLLVVSAGFAACGDDGEEAQGSAATSGQVVEDGDAAVQEACDRLAELGEVILSVRSAQTPDEVRAGVEEPLDTFVRAAHATGDDELADLADRARDRFDVYLTSTDPLDAREAGDDAHIALDRSIQRCLDLGADTEFPQEPGTPFPPDTGVTEFCEAVDSFRAGIAELDPSLTPAERNERINELSEGLQDLAPPELHDALEVIAASDPTEPASAGDPELQAATAELGEYLEQECGLPTDS